MALSPMMEQYNKIVDEYPDCIIFFRLGDFYEMFFEQAKICSKELELTLTGKECGIEGRAPMCGIPFHSANPYVLKLVQKGYKVAICEQVGDPKLSKGLVKREVVKIITPGTIIENTILDEKNNNFVANIYLVGKEYAISYSDISTGECFVSSSNDLSAIYKIIDEIIKISPKELVLEDNILNNQIVVKELINKSNIYISKYNIQENLEEKIVGIADEKLTITEINSLNLLLNYINHTQKYVTHQINKIQKYNIEKYMRLSDNTRKNLEILESIQDKTKKGSLLWLLDKTHTAMGARNIKKWIENPLLDKKSIEQRLAAVNSIKKDPFAKEEISDVLKNIYDIERIMSKVVNSSVNARDMIALKNSIKMLPSLKLGLEKLDKDSQYIEELYLSLDLLQDVYELIDSSIEEDTPINIKDGGIIKASFNKEVNELKNINKESKNWIVELEKKEREITKINKLKIGYNRVFGYYIEITKSNYNMIPKERYVRKQTLADKERFITEELKDIEEKILRKYRETSRIGI